VKLRDVTEADFEALYEHQRDEEASRIAGVEPRDRDAFYTHWRTIVLPNPDGHAQAIEVDGVVVGDIVSWQNGEERLLGYWLGRQFWNRGIATAAVREYLAKHELKRPLHAYVSPQNVGSIRVLEKCGFRFIGDERYELVR
jgi:RimJ/RimL family protein N-acetyltransferase